jgi:hypothetical protein
MAAITKIDLFGTNDLKVEVSVPAGYATKWMTIRRTESGNRNEITMWFEDLQDIVNFGVLISQAAMAAMQEEADNEAVEVEM